MRKVIIEHCENLYVSKVKTPTKVKSKRIIGVVKFAFQSLKRYQEKLVEQQTF